MLLVSIVFTLKLPLWFGIPPAMEAEGAREQMAERAAAAKSVLVMVVLLLDQVLLCGATRAARRGTMRKTTGRRCYVGNSSPHDLVKGRQAGGRRNARLQVSRRSSSIGYLATASGARPARYFSAVSGWPSTGGRLTSTPAKLVASSTQLR